MDAETFRKEKNSITRFGFVVPLVVRRMPDRSYQLVDGEHRLKAALELGMTEVPVFDIGPIGDSEAKQLTILLNELHGSPEPDKLAEVLRDLLASETLDTLTEVLPFSKDEFAKVARLPEYDWDKFKEKMSSGSSERWKERIFRMPPDASAVLDRALEMAKARSESDLKDWQALEAVAAGYLAGEE